MYRVMAERAEREQAACLRFDYHGTADAPGEEGDQTMAAWADDVLAAHQCLTMQAGVGVIWFGMRLGANIALRAAAMARTAPSQLVLWDPVVDGPAYLEAVLASHQSEAAGGKGLMWEQLLARGIESQPVLPGNVLGFQFGSGLVEEIRLITTPALGGVLRRGVQVTIGAAVSALERIASQYGAADVNLIEMAPQPDWLCSRAAGTPVAPADIFGVLRRALEAS
jgi:uncharacterized protein